MLSALQCSSHENASVRLRDKCILFKFAKTDVLHKDKCADYRVPCPVLTMDCDKLCWAIPQQDIIKPHTYTGDDLDKLVTN